MATVSVSKFKARLAFFLREVKRGGEVQLVERGVPIARVVGMTNADKVGRAGSQMRARLIGSGLVRPGRANVAEVLRKKPISLSTSLSEALSEERKDRL